MLVGGGVRSSTEPLVSAVRCWGREFEGVTCQRGLGGGPESGPLLVSVSVTSGVAQCSGREPGCARTGPWGAPHLQVTQTHWHDDPGQSRVQEAGPEGGGQRWGGARGTPAWRELEAEAEDGGRPGPGAGFSPAACFPSRRTCGPGRRCREVHPCGLLHVSSVKSLGTDLGGDEPQRAPQAADAVGVRAPRAKIIVKQEVLRFEHLT